mmetsp:Transcript_4471/g.11211  ORF Transcript_4471/g.11211 Transcript_4471/m.11211 type:complete len:110 (-) Transcript_4471:792-1121(-)
MSSNLFGGKFRPNPRLLAASLRTKPTHAQNSPVNSGLPNLERRKNPIYYIDKERLAETYTTLHYTNKEPDSAFFNTIHGTHTTQHNTTHKLQTELENFTFFCVVPTPLV